MAINAYTTGTNTTLSNHNIDVKPDVQHGDQLYWNGTYNLFETDRAVNIDLSDYATRQFVQEQIAIVGSGNIGWALRKLLKDDYEIRQGDITDGFDASDISQVKDFLKDIFYFLLEFDLYLWVLM